ncbi:MAG: hypothetical protein Q8R02_22795 [Hyphomonadaceae bacterium]|nr:hypothetical protein [Hyphomonadaceae bacterium]
MKTAIAIALLVALAPAAAAQKIARAEQGSVALSFDAFTHAHQTVTVKPGETAWTETVRAAKAVRLVEAAVERSRPKVAGVPAGTVMFGYQLSTGVAYCAPIDTARVNTDVQCLRDLDGDGTFDGSYITSDRGADSRYFSSFLKSLVAIPKTRYEPATSADLPPASARLVFSGMKNGAPRFNIFIERDKSDKPIDCKIVQPGVCEALGVRLAFGAAAEPKGAVTLSFERAAENRGLNLYDPANHLQP